MTLCLRLLSLKQMANDFYTPTVMLKDFLKLALQAMAIIQNKLCCRIKQKQKKKPKSHTSTRMYGLNKVIQNKQSCKSFNIKMRL